MTYRDRVCLIVCENLLQEAMAALFAEQLPGVALATFPARCDQPDVNWDMLAPIPRGDPSHLRLYVTGPCAAPGLGDPPAQLTRVRRLAVDSCLHLFITRSLAGAYTARGCVLLPPWEVARWQQEGTPPAGLQGATRLVLVDTQADGAAAALLPALAGGLGLPWEVLPAGVDLFRLFLVRAMLEARLAEEQSRSTVALSEAIRRSSDHAMALDLIGGLTRMVTETEAIDNILDLFTLLFAPGSLVYVPWVDGRPGAVQVRPAGQAEAEGLAERLEPARLQNDYCWSSTGSGFYLRIAHQEETLGLLAIEEVAFPEHLDHYLNLALILGRVCGLTIANARSYEKGRQAEHIIRHQAYHDALTGLPNRRLFSELLHQALERAHHEGTVLAVLFIDLDHFKQVNDSLGHDTGDALIRETAYRLQKAVRTGDVLARMGGDEFLLLLTEIAQPEDALRVAERIRAGLAAPFPLAGQELHVTASIGVTLYPRDGTDAETLIKNADAAMYRVKQAGRDGCRVYGEEDGRLTIDD